MSGLKPAFITGASAKIKIAGKTWAYASDVQYQVTVDTIPVETMGRYEAVSNEPVNYSVAGGLSIVRYTALATAAAVGGASGSKINGANASGNGVGVADGNIGGSSKASDHLNPGNILFSQTFDLEVFQKTQDTRQGSNTAVAAIPAAGKAFIKIIDCRFTSKSGDINKRGILVERLNFVGILAQDDSFDVYNSGDPDLA